MKPAPKSQSAKSAPKSTRTQSVASPPVRTTPTPKPAAPKGVDHLAQSARHSVLADQHRAQASLHEAQARLQGGTVNMSKFGGSPSLTLPGEK